MVNSGTDSELENLVQELGQLFNQQNSYVNPKSKVPVSPGEYQAPLKGAYYNSGNFSPGVATDPRHQKGHNGVDLRSSLGAPVYPLAPGLVTHIGTDPVGGNTINIQHANGVRSYYAHLSTVKVHKGDKVDNTTVIGTVGDSGNAKGTWPHLHFQVWKDGQLQNPASFFAVPPYTKVDKSKEKWWASEGAKDEVASFNMKKHIESNKIAFTRDINQLYKIAETYYQLVKALR